MDWVSPSVDHALQVCNATAAHFHVVLLNGALKNQLSLDPRADVKPILKALNAAMKQFNAHPPAITQALRSNLAATRDQLNGAQLRIFHPGDDVTLPPDDGGTVDTGTGSGTEPPPPPPPPPPPEPEPEPVDPAAPVREAATLFGPDSFPNTVIPFSELSPEDQAEGQSAFISSIEGDIDEYLKNLAQYLQVYPEWPATDIVAAIVSIVGGAASILGSVFGKVQAFAIDVVPRMLAEVEEQLVN
ncbi:hypothetical protein [Paludibaculum fermentans]|uniref:hypothetical protein n=1 Tax=Paludibaculum fermentans TaxID=1473598 RepID=UPI003EBDFA1F